MRERMGALVLAVMLLSSAVAAETGPPAKPNVLIIVADDLGFSDIGAFGGEISTPNLDSLANRGIRMTGFHVSPTCSVTRAMLLTGADNHEVGLGSMAEVLTAQQRGRPGYEGVLNERAPPLSQIMRDGGYRTLMAGKWHLGVGDGHRPQSRGFERSFALLEGASNYFGLDQNPRYAAPYAPATYREDDEPVTLPKGFYSTDYFADRIAAFIRDEPKDRRPIFAYLAFTAPHWPLQAPDETIAKYKGRYDTGPEALRQERLAKQIELGLLNPNVKPHPMVAAKPWESLHPDQRAIEARKMEVYAAMVDRMDAAIGRVFDALRDTGRLENTLIVFLSDNGAEGFDSSEGVMGRGFYEWIAATWDNGLNNIGRGNSYVWYGPGWAQAATAPAFLFKSYLAEGGIRSPAIVAGPGIGGGRISDAFLDVSDVTPTVLDVTATARPAGAFVSQRGRSWINLLAGKSDEVRASSEFVGYELFYSKAIRQGDWKALFLTQRTARRDPSIVVGRWQLFNLKDDPGETMDLSHQRPRKLKALVAAWERYADEVGVVRATTPEEGGNIGPPGGVIPGWSSDR